MEYRAVASASSCQDGVLHLLETLQEVSDGRTRVADGAHRGRPSPTPEEHPCAGPISASERVRVLYGDALDRRPTLPAPRTGDPAVVPAAVQAVPEAVPGSLPHHVPRRSQRHRRPSSSRWSPKSHRRSDLRRRSAGVLALGFLALGLGLVEGGLAFLRRWIMSIGTLGSETGVRLDLYAKPAAPAVEASMRSGSRAAEPHHERPVDDAAVHRVRALMIVMNVLQITVVTALLLHLYWPMGLVVVVSAVPVVWVCLGETSAPTRGCRAIQDQTGDVASTVESRCSPSASSRRSAAPRTCSPSSTDGREPCTGQAWSASATPAGSGRSSR